MTIVVKTRTFFAMFIKIQGGQTLKFKQVGLFILTEMGPLSIAIPMSGIDQR
jgi:hypothetical protein